MALSFIEGILSVYRRLLSIVCFKWPKRLLPIRCLMVIVGGFLVHLSLGTIYTFGNIAPYIVSYVRNQSHPESLHESTAPWIFAFALMGQGGAMFLGGWLVNKIGPRVTTLIGGWIMSLGVALSYFTVRVSFWLMLLTYGLLFGIGVGIAYIGPLSSAMKWLPKWKGFANGIVVAGFGSGALIFNAVQTFFINPDNYKSVPTDPSNPDEKYYNQADLLDRVPLTFLVLAGTYAVMQLIGSLLITDPPEDYHSQAPTETPFNMVNNSLREVEDPQHCGYPKEDEKYEPKSIQRRKTSTDRYGSTSPEGSDNSTPIRTTVRQDDCTVEDDRPQGEVEKARLLQQEDEKGEERFEESTVSTVSWTNNVLTSLTPKQMLLKLNFYLLWLMFMSNGMAVLFTATLYKFFGTSVVNDDHFLAIVGSVAAVFNCLGRICWGLLADRFSYKFALVLLTGTFTIFTLTFYACILGGKVMFFIWVCIIFFCIGGVFSLFPTSIGRAFGLKYVAINYGLLFTSQIIAGSLGAMLSTVLYKLIGIQGLMFVVSGFTLFALVLALLYRPKRYIMLRT